MNKLFFKVALLFGAVAAFASCSETETEVATVDVNVESSMVTVNPESGSTATLAGSSSAAWTVTADADGDWFTLSDESGNAGDFSLTITTTEANPTTIERFSKFTIAAGERRIPVTVKQVGVAIAIATSTQSMEFDAEGVMTSTTALTVTSNAAWVAATEAEWIHLTTTEGEASDEAQAIEFTVDPNASIAAQEAEISVCVPGNDPILVVVKQAGAAFNATVDTSAIEGKTLNGAGDKQTISIQANASWSIATTDDWYSIDVKEGEASTEATVVTFTVDPNEDFTNGRDGSFAINFEGFDSETITVNFSQAKGEQPGEALDLINLVAALQGAGSYTPNWNMATNTADWEGVTFEAGKLVSLELPSKGLAGTIPAELGAFAELRTIDLSGNDLTGNIPAEIGTLAKLTTFKVSMNQLAGTVPCGVINSNYPQWDAMTNVYPQQGSTDVENPAGLQLKLESIGLLRVMYWSLNGPEWTWSTPEGVTEPEWLYNDEVVLEAGQVGVSHKAGTGALQGFGNITGGMAGVMPTETGMLTSFAQLRIAGAGQLTGELPLSLVKNLNYILMTGHQIEMDIEKLFSSLRSSVKEIQFKGNKLYGENGIPASIIDGAKTLGTGFNVSNNADLKGEVTAEVKEFLMGKMKDTDGTKFQAQVLDGTGLFVVE